MVDHPIDARIVGAGIVVIDIEWCSRTGGKAKVVDGAGIVRGTGIAIVTGNLTGKSIRLALTGFLTAGPELTRVIPFFGCAFVDFPGVFACPFSITGLVGAEIAIRIAGRALRC